MAYKIQLKHGPGWFAVEADDYDSFFADLATVLGQEKAESIIRAIQAFDLDPVEPAGTTAGNYFAGTSAPAAAPPAPPAPPAAPPAPPAAPAAPAAPSGLPADWETNAPFCQHGQRRAKSWPAKTGPNAGKMSYAWFCPLPQDQRANQCKAIDAATGKEWAR